jgi:hypothetical protein
MTCTTAVRRLEPVKIVPVVKSALTFSMAQQEALMQA